MVGLPFALGFTCQHGFVVEIPALPCNLSVKALVTEYPQETGKGLLDSTHDDTD